MKLFFTLNHFCNIPVSLKQLTNSLDSIKLKALRNSRGTQRHALFQDAGIILDRVLHERVEHEHQPYEIHQNKAKIGCTPDAKGVPLGELPRSEKKTQRIFDSRY